MPKTANVYKRVEPELKEQVEIVLSKLGIPMANAINLFLHQIVLHNGIPFDVKVPQKSPLDYSALTEEQFDAEIDRGMESLGAGKVTPSADVRAKIQRQYSV